MAVNSCRPDMVFAASTGTTPYRFDGSAGSSGSRGSLSLYNCVWLKFQYPIPIVKIPAQYGFELRTCMRLALL